VATWAVSGYLRVPVSITVEADDPKEANRLGSERLNNALPIQTIKERPMNPVEPFADWLETAVVVDHVGHG